MMQSNEFAPENGADFGARLQRAREQAGLTHEDVAARLKIPVRVIRQLEAGDYAQLGAPVFVRGQLRSYARLLGVDLEDLNRSPVAQVAPSPLVSHVHTPRYKRVLEQAGRRAIYIVMTAAIAVPVWFGTFGSRTPQGQADVASLDVDPAQVADAPAPVAPRAPAPTVERTPLVASMAPLPAHTPAAPQPALALEFTGESWMQVRGPDGKVVEEALLGAGERRSYDAGAVARVVLGNSEAVRVLRGGQPVDLAPFSRAKVARFTLSSDGSLAPVAD
ncbi:RodZ domain-containing protein [Vulcaniibacterium tengchongense]|uniref:Cytoskeleton protein RodZ n=1 Tax=Vulcaniibacterium tengchongense TaxID=1273429 RepID=A0A3N4W8Z1_9GAMM|nr:RodZ domain-containing protein [Vulcaniibacterium tengchongense]RPE81704.1 cytoskeleton protein RodZ [Vulcaniibacterium tengchongense]